MIAVSIALGFALPYLLLQAYYLFYWHKTKTVSGGIGLQNIKKRLELIYPGKYELTVNEEAGMFIVKLQLQLNPAEKIQTVTVNGESFVNPIPAAV